MFSCEFCEIFKNTFFTENLQATTSGIGSISKTCNLVQWLSAYQLYDLDLCTWIRSESMISQQFLFKLIL